MWQKPVSKRPQKWLVINPLCEEYFHGQIRCLRHRGHRMNDKKSVGHVLLEVKPVSIRGEGTLRGPLLRLPIERVEAQEPERMKQ